MSSELPHASPRAQALAAARRRLHWLEVEAHRMKAQLARLEAEFEDGVADELSEAQDEAEPPADFEPYGEPPADFSAAAAPRNGDPPLVAVDLSDRIVVNSAPRELSPARGTNGADSAAWPAIGTDAFRQEPAPVLAGNATKADGPLAPARSLLASFGIHIAVLLIALPLTYATLVHKKQPPPTESVVVEQALPEPAAPEVDGANIDGLDTQQALFADTKTDLASQLLSDLPRDSAPSTPSIGLPLAGTPGIPIADLGGSGTPAAIGDGGSGKGGPADAGGGAGGRGNAIGSAEFFGAKSRGDRFVFIVDDSSSMKDGRLEAAIAELTRSVEAMSRRQAFYVIFVSDKTYPMFYPDRAADLLPATPENKKLLGQWLGKVRLASGKNRELITAMDAAAALRPHAVFLLWDGDLRYSEAVRNDVMNHLTEPQIGWNFAVNTLGMGTLSPDSESNLAAIAAAHKGAYRRIDVPKPDVPKPTMR